MQAQATSAGTRRATLADALHAYRNATSRANAATNDDDVDQLAGEAIDDATAALADAPARTPLEVGAKLDVLREILVDENGGPDHVDQRMLGLLDAVRRDVAKLHPRTAPWPSPMNMHTSPVPSLAEAQAAYTQAVKTERALRADDSISDDEIGNSHDREQAALRAYIAMPARAPADVIAKLFMLRTLLLDETMWNDAPPLDRETAERGDTYDADMLALIDGIVADVYSGNASVGKPPIVKRIAVLRSRTNKSPRPPATAQARPSSSGTFDASMDAYDLMTLRLSMIGTILDLALSGQDERADDGLLGTLACLIGDARAAAENMRTTSTPAVRKAAAS